MDILIVVAFPVLVFATMLVVFLLNPNLRKRIREDRIRKEQMDKDRRLEEEVNYNDSEANITKEAFFANMAMIQMLKENEPLLISAEKIQSLNRLDFMRPYPLILDIERMKYEAEKINRRLTNRGMLNSKGNIQSIPSHLDVIPIIVTMNEDYTDNPETFCSLQLLSTQDVIENFMCIRTKFIYHKLSQPLSSVTFQDYNKEIDIDSYILAHSNLIPSHIIPATKIYLSPPKFFSIPLSEHKQCYIYGCLLIKSNRSK